MKAILLVLTLAVVANAFTEREYQFAFSSWMRSFSKQYAAEEFKLRYEAFKRNMDYVRDWNAAGSPTVRKYYCFVVFGALQQLSFRYLVALSRAAYAHSP